jgi:hypothetical protein
MMAAAPGLLSASDEVSVDYEMGDLKKTSTYLFILKNNGNSDASNIQLSCDNPNVTMIPSSIGILSPVSAGGVQPVIQVTVQHGYNATGIGTAPTLSSGRLTFTISASVAEPSNGQNNGNASAILGMTVRNTKLTIAAGYNANSNGNAQCTNANAEGVVSRKTNSSYGTITASQWSLWSPTFWGAITAPSGDTALQIASIAPIIVSNTGNSQLFVDVYRGYGSDEAINYLSFVSLTTIVIGASEEITPQIVTEGVGQMAWTLLRIHGEGAVFDSTGNFQPDSNGDLWVEVMTGTGYTINN